MASTMEGSSAQSLNSKVYEWPISNIGRMLISNRSIGSPSTINILLTFPSPSSVDVTRLTTRLAEIQELWPLLCITIADQRTTKPKCRYNYSQWDTEQVLAHKTYVANPDDLKAERDDVYETALRLFQQKVSYGADPLWRVTLFRAASNAENERLYLCLTIDHIIIDGRGSVKIAHALVADDISHLPKEDIELYERAGFGKEMDEPPPITFILPVIFREVVCPLLPVFVQRLLGYCPNWPQKITQPTIDSPWKSSILEVSSSLTGKVKEIGKKHGVATLNPTLYMAWMVSIWATIMGREKDQEIRGCSVKDLRDPAKGHPYCVSGSATSCMWSPGVMTDESRFWEMAKAYAVMMMDPQSYADGLNLMRMLTLVPDGPIDPEKCQYRAPNKLELPMGDKQAHHKREEEALKKINSLSPYKGISGIWSNLSYLPLPKGATDMIFGVSGNATGTAFNTCVIGHENGARLQNAYSDGAAMGEVQLKKAERLFSQILERLVNEDEPREWCLGDLVEGL